jgi:nicotinate-nucleotide adenylyltransferase
LGIGKLKLTGIYGGTFNPIHNGHLQLGQYLVEEGLVEELWFLVSPQNPFKVNMELMPDAERLRLTQLAVRGHSKLKVSDFEFRMPRPSYMVHTLEAMRRHYPRREFILVIGADNWERFPQWYRSEDILAHHRLIILPRPGSVLRNVPPNCIVARTPLLDISSTEIRRQITTNPNYRGEGLPPVVWNEILKNHGQKD